MNRLGDVTGKALQDVCKDDLLAHQVQEEAYYQETVYRFCRLLEEAYGNITVDNQEEWDTLMYNSKRNLPPEVFSEVFGLYDFGGPPEEFQQCIGSIAPEEQDSALGCSTRQTC